MTSRRTFASKIFNEAFLNKADISSILTTPLFTEWKQQTRAPTDVVALEWIQLMIGILGDALVNVTQRASSSFGASTQKGIQLMPQIVEV